MSHLPRALGAWTVNLLVRFDGSLTILWCPRRDAIRSSRHDTLFCSQDYLLPLSTNATHRLGSHCEIFHVFVDASHTGSKTGRMHGIAHDRGSRETPQAEILACVRESQVRRARILVGSTDRIWDVSNYPTGLWLESMISQARIIPVLR